MNTSIKYRHHFLFCTGNKCLGKGNEELKLGAQSRIASLGLDQDILVTKTGCLDQCEYGPMVLVYPEGSWFSGMDERSVCELIDQVTAEKPLLPRHLFYQIDQKKG
ncbi:MAG: (2Fe-2S) ferredoxin domain-containing protein [Leptospirales bacterium]